MRSERGRVWQVLAVILHRRAYRETSLLLDVFSEDFGRLRVLAKGARRRQTSQWQCLQSFLPLRLSWAGRGELAVLVGAEPAGPWIALEGVALFCGFYMNELLLHLLPPEDPHPETFRLYLNSLLRLGSESERESVLRGFELALLEEIGYGLTLDRVEGGGAIDPAKAYAYFPDRGLVEVSSHRADAVQGATLLGLMCGNLQGPDQLREAKRLLRQAIEFRLEGRILKSRELFIPYAKTSNP